MHILEHLTRLLASLSFSARPVRPNCEKPNAHRRPSPISGVVGRSVQVAPVPEMNSGSGMTGSANAASSSLSVYTPVSVGNVFNSSSSIAAPGVGTRVNSSSNILNGNNVNVQTNIDDSKTINVTETINGSVVDYGLNGANAMNVIDSANDFATAVNSDSLTNADDAVTEALLIASLQN